MVCVSLFFFKQKTAYEMRISDWSSDVCSSDLATHVNPDTAEVDEDVVGTLHRVWGHNKCVVYARVVEGGEIRPGDAEIGRASCRERVCQYVSISVVAVYIQIQSATDQFWTTPCTNTDCISLNFTF